jgi:hypothetical protein
MDEINSQYQHRIAVAEKPVSVFDGSPVSFEYKVFACKRANEK